MGLASTVLGILGFGVGLPLGFLLGFFVFVYCKPDDVEERQVTLIQHLDMISLQQLSPNIPLWIKSPDYERVDWLNNMINWHGFNYLILGIRANEKELGQMAKFTYKQRIKV